MFACRQRLTISSLIFSDGLSLPFIQKSLSNLSVCFSDPPQRASLEPKSFNSINVKPCFYSLLSSVSGTQPLTIVV